MGRIEHEAERMGNLVDDLLLLAACDAELPLEHQPPDLRVVVRARRRRPRRRSGARLDHRRCRAVHRRRRPRSPHPGGRQRAHQRPRAHPGGPPDRAAASGCPARRCRRRARGPAARGPSWPSSTTAPGLPPTSSTRCSSASTAPMRHAPRERAARALGLSITVGDRRGLTGARLPPGRRQAVGRRSPLTIPVAGPPRVPEDEVATSELPRAPATAARPAAPPPGGPSAYRTGVQPRPTGRRPALVRSARSMRTGLRGRGEAGGDVGPVGDVPHRVHERSLVVEVLQVERVLPGVDHEQRDRAEGDVALVVEDLLDDEATAE